MQEGAICCSEIVYQLIAMQTAHSSCLDQPKHLKGTLTYSQLKCFTY